jgi:hypothetical protein
MKVRPTFHPTFIFQRARSFAVIDFHITSRIVDIDEVPRSSRGKSIGLERLINKGFWEVL